MSIFEKVKIKMTFLIAKSTQSKKSTQKVNIFCIKIHVDFSEGVKNRHFAFTPHIVLRVDYSHIVQTIFGV